MSSEKLKYTGKHTIKDSIGQLGNEAINKRSDAALQIIKNIETIGKDEEQLKSSLKQLIKALGIKRNPRNSLQQRSGISASLAQILHQHKQISIGDVLKFEEESLIIRNPSSKNESNTVLGKILVYSTLIQSGKLRKAATEDVSKLTQSLLECKKWQAPLHVLCLTALSHLMKKVSIEHFSEAVFPILKPQLTCGWESCTPDTLFLLISARRFHPELIKGHILVNHWDCKKILHKGNNDHIKKVLGQVRQSEALTHPVFQEVANLALKKSNEAYAEFWKKAIFDPFLSSKKRYIIFAMSLWGLKTVTCVEQVDAIMSERFVEMLMKNAVVNGSPYGKEASHIIKQLPEMVKDYPEGDIQFAVLKALLKSTYGLQFLQSRPGENILMKMSQEGGEALYTYLQALFEGHQQVLASRSISEADQRQIVGILCSLVQQQYATGGMGSSLSILQLLFRVTHGNIIKGNKTLLHCQQVPTLQVSSNVRQAAGSTLTKCLNRLATFNPGISVKVHHKQYIDTLYELSQYVQALVSNPESVELPSHFRDKMLSSWTGVVEVVEKIRSKHIKGPDLGQGHGFELLFLHMGLQLFQPKATNDAIKDLHVCYEKAFQKRRKSTKIDSEEPSWVEVVIEVLLSILSQHSSMDRAVVNTVFSILCPYITTNQAIQLLFDALHPPSEDGPLDFEDSDDEASDEETLSVENGVEENGEEEAGEEEVEDNSSEEDEEPDVDDKFRETVKQALGDAADKSDEESDDDLDDEAMSRLNVMLAAAFKSRTSNSKKAKQEREKQVLDFKHRVIQLLEIYAKSDAPASVVLEMLHPILEFIDGASRQKNQKPLATKATNVLHLLYSSKNVATDSRLTKNELPELVKTLIELSKKVSGGVKDVASAIVYVVKIAMSLQKMTVPSPVRTRSRSVKADGQGNPKKQGDILEEIVSLITQSVKDFCERRDQQLNHLLFHTILEKQPILMWCLSDSLLSYIADEKNIKVYCRTQVCSMLAAMINQATPQGIGEEAWNMFFSRLQKIVSKAVGDIAQKDLKVKFVQELLLVLYKAVKVSSQPPEYLPDTFEQDLQKLKSRGDKDIMTSCNKLFGLLHRHPKRQREDVGDHDATVPKKKKVPTATLR